MSVENSLTIRTDSLAADATVFASLVVLYGCATTLRSTAHLVFSRNTIDFAVGSVVPAEVNVSFLSLADGNVTAVSGSSVAAAGNQMRLHDALSQSDSHRSFSLAVEPSDGNLFFALCLSWLTPTYQQPNEPPQALKVRGEADAVEGEMEPDRLHPTDWRRQLVSASSWGPNLIKPPANDEDAAAAAECSVSGPITSSPYPIPQLTATLTSIAAETPSPSPSISDEADPSLSASTVTGTASVEVDPKPFHTNTNTKSATHTAADSGRGEGDGEPRTSIQIPSLTLSISRRKDKPRTLAPIPAPLSDAANKATVVTGGIVSVVAIAGGVSVVGGQLGVANALTRMASCVEETDDEVDDALPLLVHPLQFSLFDTAAGDGLRGAYAASVISNTIIIPCAVAALALGPVQLLLRLVKGGGLAVMPRAEALTEMGWPSLLVMPFATLGEGIGVGIVRSFRGGSGGGYTEGQNTIAVAAGLFGLAALVAFSSAWVYVLVRVIPRRSCR